MTNTGILIITIGVVIITFIICATVFVMSWYDTWRREYIHRLKKYVDYQYHIATKGAEMDSIFNKEFKTIIITIKEIVDKL